MMKSRWQGGSEPVKWAGVLEAVAAALSQTWLPAGADEPAQSVLAALTQTAPRSLRRAVERHAAADGAGGNVEPLLHQNELPLFLLAHGMFEAAAEAVTAQGWLPAAAGQSGDRVVAAAAVSALSTIRSDRLPDGLGLSQVLSRLGEFEAPAWGDALAALVRRTTELHDLMQAVRGTRLLQWRGVAPDDRILAEAAAAAVVGGAASASGVPPASWQFPFHLFCKLGVSAAEDAADAIERWLGIEFPPAPRTAERTVSLAALVAAEAASLSGGCRCKDGIDAGEVAFVPRGACRQQDHDLRLWRPGETRPGSRGGGRFASTLWGWQRRWLGGADAGHVPGAPSDGARPRLRPNDVAGSVLARRWFAADRGSGGLVLRYDRILPEFCLNCDARVRLDRSRTAGRRARIQRADCCENAQHVYRSEISHRGGGHQIRHRLGIVVAAQDDGTPGAGYCPTVPLGELWVCLRSGRYSLAALYCPDEGCGRHNGDGHTPVGHAWVLLPRGQAWADLRATAFWENAGGVVGAGLSGDDMRFLKQVFDAMVPGAGSACHNEVALWDQARRWSAREAERFRKLAGERGLGLLLRCKQIAEGGT